MTKSEFLKMVKDHMRDYKNQWLNGTFDVDGRKVGIKLYNKSIARLEIDGLCCPGGWDIPTQKEVISRIEKYL